MTKHLNEHRDRSSFTFALAARSKSKLEALVKEFDLSAQVPLVYLDVTNEAQVEEVVKSARVVINTVGPYWKWGTPVVRWAFFVRGLCHSLQFSMVQGLRPKWRSLC